MSANRSIQRRHLRRAATLVYVAVSATLLLSMGALAIDIGRMYLARAELQASADASAMAAAWALLDENRLKGLTQLDQVCEQARVEAARVAGLNHIFGLSPALDANEDILLEYLRGGYADLSDPSSFNAVQVVVRRNQQRNGPIDMLFARILGLQSKGLVCSATACFRDGVVGYRADERTGNAELMPIALRLQAWQNLLNGSVTNGDHFTFDHQTQLVTAGPDGIPELNIYPGAGGGQLPPGNFGTVDIGSPNNSTADISRQIRYGITPDDLAYFGGELKLDEHGELMLNGDTGLSAGIKDDLTSIIGQARAIPLFTQVAGPGNNAEFTVVGFAGLRVLAVQLNGAMRNKAVIVQPAFVVDGSTIVSDSGTSYYVYQPVRLVQ